MYIAEVARRFLHVHGLTLPVQADEALRHAGFWPVAHPGPATVHGDALRFDRTRNTWQREVWSIVCGRILTDAGVADTYAHRGELMHSLSNATRLRLA